MKRLLEHRQEEVKAVDHEVELVDVILTMCHKIEEHKTGMVTVPMKLVTLICWSKFNTDYLNIHHS